PCKDEPEPCENTTIGRSRPLVGADTRTDRSMPRACAGNTTGCTETMGVGSTRFMAASRAAVPDPIIEISSLGCAAVGYRVVSHNLNRDAVPIKYTGQRPG